MNKNKDGFMDRQKADSTEIKSDDFPGQQ